MCNDCHGTGKVQLFTSTVVCECMKTLVVEDESSGVGMTVGQSTESKHGESPLRRAYRAYIEAEVFSYAQRKAFLKGAFPRAPNFTKLTPKELAAMADISERVSNCSLKQRYKLSRGLTREEINSIVYTPFHHHILWFLVATFVTFVSDSYMDVLYEPAKKAG